jgi:hypothetical protein
MAKFDERKLEYLKGVVNTGYIAAGLIIFIPFLLMMRIIERR